MSNSMTKQDYKNAIKGMNELIRKMNFPGRTIPEIIKTAMDLDYNSSVEVNGDPLEEVLKDGRIVTKGAAHGSEKTGWLSIFFPEEVEWVRLECYRPNKIGGKFYYVYFHTTHGCGEEMDKPNRFIADNPSFDFHSRKEDDDGFENCSLKECKETLANWDKEMEEEALLYLDFGGDKCRANLSYDLWDFYEEKFGKSAVYWTDGEKHDMCDEVKGRPEDYLTQGWTDEYFNWEVKSIIEALEAGYEDADEVLNFIKEEGTIEVNHAKKESRRKGDRKVGKQKFTYAELEEAWKKVKAVCEEEGKEYPDQTYDFRNQYSVTPDKDLDNTNYWYADWNFKSVCKAIEDVDEEITYGDLEVYWNDEKANNADSADHGIIFEDGKIKKVY